MNGCEKIFGSMIIAYFTKDKNFFDIQVLSDGINSDRFKSIYNDSIKSSVGDKTQRVWDNDGIIWRYIGGKYANIETYENEYDYEYIMNTDIFINNADKKVLPSHNRKLPKEIKQFLRDYKINQIL